MSVVADVSVVLAWFFEEVQTAQALEILDAIHTDGLLVPPLWWSEVENGILMGERRGRKSEADSKAFLKLIRGLPIQTDDVARLHVSDDILAIARRFSLTSYDATYVELTRRASATLATFDSNMRRAAAKLKLKMVPGS